MEGWTQGDQWRPLGAPSNHRKNEIKENNETKFKNHHKTKRKKKTKKNFRGNIKQGINLLNISQVV